MLSFQHLPGLRIEHQTPRLEAPLALDGAVFVGVAPRGPARVPVVDARWPAGSGQVDPARPRLRSVAVAIDSLDAYRRRFGEVESGAYLGRAVSAFFAQGGRRCWVMRIVSRLQPAPSSSASCSLLRAAGLPLLWRARDEGAWGNALRGELQLQAAPLAAEHDGLRWLSLQPADSPPGSLLRWRAGPGPWQLARVLACSRERSARGDLWPLQLDAAVPPAARVERLAVDAHFSDGLSIECFSGLGLDPLHPRALAAVLCAESQLVWPDASWAAEVLSPADASLLGTQCFSFSGGVDDFAAITPDDFFDSLAPEGFWRDEPDPDLVTAEGIDALRTLSEPAMLLAPDLYHPLGLGRDAEPVLEQLDEAGASFAPCRPGRSQLTPAAPLAFPGLQLDPRDAAQRARIVALQQRVLAFAASRLGHGPMVALLDAPPGLEAPALSRWRATLDPLGQAADAAVYAPWLLTTSQQGRLVPLPPSSVAAGIVADRERQQGLPFGPAERVAQQVVMPLQRFALPQADALHVDGINLFLPQAEGIVLRGARTLSRENGWRALAARRVLHWLLRWLHREAPWLVFEPLNDSLVEEVEIWIVNLLRRLWRAGALRGRSEREAYFVRVQRQPDFEGELRVEIGLALAEPLEFIQVRLRLADDGLLLQPALFAAAEV
jgi:hypothetical protein